jgi:predicted transcriptional regulator
LILRMCERGINRNHVADLIGVHKSTVWQIIKQERHASQSPVERYLAASSIAEILAWRSRRRV